MTTRHLPARRQLCLAFLGMLVTTWCGGFAQQNHSALFAADQPAKVFRAGAAAIDISPVKLPVIVNGNMNEVIATEINDRLHARALVLDDGKTQVAIVIIDNCMIPRDLLDRAKALATEATGIPTNHMLTAATHAHSAPSVHACLGTDPDVEYTKFLPGKIAEAITTAHKRLAPARIGFGLGRDEKNVGCRRWLMQPGTAPNNIFSGKKNDLAQMHPGFNNPKAIRATGPTDPDVPVLAVQTLEGKPVATLTNYSMHYVGAKAISADYFPLVCNKLQALLKADSDYVGLHSNGTSGDQWLLDYNQPSRRTYSIDSVSTDVAQAAYEAYQKITFHDWVPLVMEEELLELNVRMPTADEVRAARKIVDGLGLKRTFTGEEIYARETVLLNDMAPTRELKLQALRIGELGITGIPNEVFAISGITIKKRSPLKSTFTIELANGCEGYIPPAEQHVLGGYETWRARTSCLEELAEVKIVSKLVNLLHTVAASRADELPVASK